MPTKKTSRAEARNVLSKSRVKRIAISSKKATTGRTYVNIVLDESGSMTTTEAETISGVNTYLESLKTTPKVYVTLTKFSSNTNVLYAMEPIKKASLLNTDNYRPNGFTALYDAIGVCVKAMSKEVKKGDRVLTVIVTDGAENSSKEWNREQVKTLITEHEAKGNWTFTFLAANLDVKQFAQATGMSLGNTFSYQSTSIGTRQAFDTLKSATANYMSATAADGRSGLSQSMTSFYTPEEPQVKRISLGPKRRVIP